MDNFLDHEFLSNPIRDYIWVIGVILFVLFLNRLISKYIAILVCKLFKRAWKTFDQDKFVSLIIHPLGIFLVITVSIVALYRLNFPADLNITLYKYPVQRILLSIAITIQIVSQLFWSKEQIRPR
jgi:MscS family membrane protein